MRTVWTALLAMGCSDGRVKLDEEPFGTVRSAVWFDFAQDAVENEDVRHHRLVLSTTPGLCKEVQDVMQPLSEAFSANLDFEPYDEEETCNATKSWYQDAGELVDKWYRKDGANMVVLEFYDPDADISDPPDATTYVQGYADTSHYYFGTVILRSANLEAAIGEEIRCGDASEAVYDDVDEAIAEVQQLLFLNGGTLILEENKTGDRRMLKDFSTNVVDDDGDARGQIELSAGFDLCEVSWTGALPPPF